MPDWKKIKMRYVTSNKSYAEIAEEYKDEGVMVHEVDRHGKKEKWVQARRDYQEKLFQKTLEKTSDKQSNVLAKLMSASVKTAAIIDEISGNRDHFFPETTDFGGNTRKNFSGRDLREFTTAIKDLTATIRDLYGIPTRYQLQKWELEKEKWELEKKLKQRELDGENVNKLEVVIDSSLEDYTV